MKKVLIIDNDPEILTLVSYLLSERGYTVVPLISATSVEEVFKMAPNIVIIDHILNGTGAALCLLLKNNPKTKHIPIILYSAHMDLEVISQHSCADAYIKKPFNISNLEQTVSRLIS